MSYNKLSGCPWFSLAVGVGVKRLALIVCFQEGIRNRTGPAEPNRTVSFRNRPEPDAEPNRTEPDRATTRPKNAGRTASNRETFVPEPNRADELLMSPEPKRLEPNRLLPVLGTKTVSRSLCKTSATAAREHVELLLRGTEHVEN